MLTEKLQRQYTPLTLLEAQLQFERGDYKSKLFVMSLFKIPGKHSITIESGQILTFEANSEIRLLSSITSEVAGFLKSEIIEDQIKRKHLLLLVEKAKEISSDTLLFPEVLQVSEAVVGEEDRPKENELELPKEMEENSVEVDKVVFEQKQDYKDSDKVISSTDAEPEIQEDPIMPAKKQYYKKKAK